MRCSGRLVTMAVCNVVALGAAFACSTFESATAEGTDGGGGDADARSPCVGAEHLRCADFDQGTFSDVFDDLRVSDGGHLDFATDTFRSAPRSLHANVDQGVGADAFLIERLLFRPSRFDATP